MLPESLLYFVEEGVHGLFGLGMRCLAHDIQKTNNWVFMVTGFDSLFPCLLLLGMGGISFFTGLYHLIHILPCPPLDVLMTHQINGKVGLFHVARNGLHCLLPASHDGHHPTDIV